MIEVVVVVVVSFFFFFPFFSVGWQDNVFSWKIEIANSQPELKFGWE